MDEAEDLAVRRRFAFVTLHPDRTPVADQPLPLATEVFDRLAAAFVEHASDDVLALLPGQAYYLAGERRSFAGGFGTSSCRCWMST